jgi:hypothetical protein
MRIAVLLSGRITRYENCLLPILEKYKGDLDLFISVNDTDGLYYDDVRINLSPWLKGIFIQPYIFPPNFKCEYKNDYIYCFQKVDGKWMPRNQMSMYWNDRKAFQMACEYAEKHSFEYDVFMRFRADLFNTSLPEIKSMNHDELNLFTVKHFCEFKTFAMHSRDPVSSDWVWGNKKTMSIYCNTYDFVLQTLEKIPNYLIHFESNHTDCMIENKIKLTTVNITYNTDSQRKAFDENWQQDDSGKYKDTRGAPPPKFKGFVSKNDFRSLREIPLTPD